MFVQLPFLSKGIQFSSWKPSAPTVSSFCFRNRLIAPPWLTDIVSIATMGSGNGSHSWFLFRSCKERDVSSPLEWFCLELLVILPSCLGAPPKTEASGNERMLETLKDIHSWWQSFNISVQTINVLSCWFEMGCGLLKVKRDLMYYQKSHHTSTFIHFLFKHYLFRRHFLKCNYI